MDIPRPVADGGAGALAAQVPRCHAMLLRLAGSVPDEMLSVCRDWLARGRLTEVARTVTHMVAVIGVKVSPADSALLTELRGPAGGFSDFFGVETSDRALIPVWSFLADAPGGGSMMGDAVAGAVGAAASTVAGVRVVWGAWRVPDNGARWPAAKRVFVVEVEPGLDAAWVAGFLGWEVRAVERAPQVEVCPVDWEMPAYQFIARGGSEVVYARDARPPIRLAEIFDAGDETGAWFFPDHPRLDGEERERALCYLAEGQLLMHSGSQLQDILRPEFGQVVPTSFRTDGPWVWNDATWYYLHHYSLAPEADFLQHMRELGFARPEVDGLDMRRAVEFLAPHVNTSATWVRKHAPGSPGPAADGIAGDAPFIRLVQVYDEPETDESGPGFHPDHPRLVDGSHADVLDYLASGSVVLRIREEIEDVLRPHAGKVVPLTWRTDGHWVWNEATEYFLRHYFLAPPSPFLDDIRDRGYEYGVVDPLDLKSALAVVMGSIGDARIPVWSSDD